MSYTDSINGIEKIFVINLERRKDRLITFQSNVKNVIKNIDNINIIKAVDGSKIELNKKKDFINSINYAFNLSDDGGV